MTETSEQQALRVSFYERLLRIMDFFLRGFSLVRESRISRRLELAREDESASVGKYWKEEFNKQARKNADILKEKEEDFTSLSRRKSRTHAENLEFESNIYLNEISKKDSEIQELKDTIKKIQEDGIYADKIIKGAGILINDCVREVESMFNEDTKKVQKFLGMSQRLKFLKDGLLREESSMLDK